MTNLGAQLRAFREAAHLTQVEVVSKIGITQGHISAIECGAREPSLHVLRQMLAVYGVTAEQAGSALLAVASASGAAEPVSTPAA